MNVVSLLLPFVVAVTLSAAETIKVACVGNSITEGDYNYPTYLQRLLGSDYQVENEGVGGTTMLKNGDKPYWTQGLLRQALAFTPDIVTIKLGTNDTKPQNWDAHGGEFKSDYFAMIDTFQALPSQPDIFLVLPVPVFEDKWGIRNSVVQELLPIIREIGNERNLPVIDANTPLQGFGQYFPDGVHPNTTGADSIAHVIYRALMERTPVAAKNVSIRACSEQRFRWSVSVHLASGTVPSRFQRRFDPLGRFISGGSPLRMTTAVVPIISRDNE